MVLSLHLNYCELSTTAHSLPQYLWIDTSTTLIKCLYQCSTNLHTKTGQNVCFCVWFSSVGWFYGLSMTFGGWAIISVYPCICTIGWIKHGHSLCNFTHRFLKSCSVWWLWSLPSWLPRPPKRANEELNEAWHSGVVLTSQPQDYCLICLYVKQITDVAT